MTVVPTKSLNGSTAPVLAQLHTIVHVLDPERKATAIVRLEKLDVDDVGRADWIVAEELRAFKQAALAHNDNSPGSHTCPPSGARTRAGRSWLRLDRVRRRGSQRQDSLGRKGVRMTSSTRTSSALPNPSCAPLVHCLRMMHRCTSPLLSYCCAMTRLICR